MIVDVFVRHSSSCSHKADRYWKHCRCRKWLCIEGSRKPVSAKTCAWEQAQQLAHQIEQERASTDPDSDPHPDRVVGSGIVVETVREAVTHFLENKKEQNLSKNWLQKTGGNFPTSQTGATARCTTLNLRRSTCLRSKTTARLGLAQSPPGASDKSACAVSSAAVCGINGSLTM